MRAPDSSLMAVLQPSNPLVSWCVCVCVCVCVCIVQCYCVQWESCYIESCASLVLCLLVAHAHLKLSVCVHSVRAEECWCLRLDKEVLTSAEKGHYTV